MTEYEIVDVIISFLSAALTSMALYLTTVTGYIVAAFIAGDRLTKLQVTIVNIFFLFVAGLFTFGTTGSLVREWSYLGKLRAISPEEPILLSAGIIWFIGITMLMGIFASLSFMWSVRHPKVE
jgi:hypothetical protein